MIARLVDIAQRFECSATAESHGAALSTPNEACSLLAARGRILAESIVADRDSPPFDTSAMDGYAVRLDDLRRGAGAALPVVGESRIGCEPPEMPTAGGAVRIVTGAPVPPGAEAVARREDVEERAGERASADDIASITLLPAAVRLAAGANIRRRGENARAGASLLDAGTILTASAIGTLASVGCAQPRVKARLRVAVIVTGDELVDPEVMPGPFQIRDSNGATMATTLSGQAWLAVEAPMRVKDQDGSLAVALRSGLSECDAVILSGGVSMGHRDPVRAAIEGIGAEVVFHGLPQRPGKPMLGAVLREDRSREHRAVPILALPGNPLSAMVTARRIVTPILAACAGASEAPRAPRIAVINPDEAIIDLWWHRLVRLSGSGDAELIDGRGSGDIAAGGRSDGFIEVPPRTRAQGSFPYFQWAV